MSKYLQVQSLDLAARVKDALRNRQSSDKYKINELANIAKELADAWKDNDTSKTEVCNFGKQIPDGLGGNDLLVYRAIQNCVSEWGISRTELEARFPNIPSEDLCQVIEFLCCEGYCYSSIDCDHFLAGN